MKFMFNGLLWTFFRDRIKVVDTYGDIYSIKYTGQPKSPFIFQLEQIRNPNYDHEQLNFESLLLKETTFI